MVKFNKVVMAGVILALVLCSAAYAQQGLGKGKRGAAAKNSELFPGCPVNLDLSTEQSAKIQDIRNGFIKDTAGLRVEIFKKDQDLSVLMLDKAVDVEKAKKLQDEISTLQGQMAQKRLFAQLEIRKVLTAEQFAKLPPGCNFGIGPGGGRGWGCGFGPGQGGGRGFGGGRGAGGGWNMEQQ